MRLHDEVIETRVGVREDKGARPKWRNKLRSSATACNHGRVMKTSEPRSAAQSGHRKCCNERDFTASHIASRSNCAENALTPRCTKLRGQDANVVPQSDVDLYGKQPRQSHTKLSSTTQRTYQRCCNESATPTHNKVRH